MIEFTLPRALTQEFLTLIPKQRQVVNQMLVEGKIRSYSLALDRSKLWAVVTANSEFDALELISGMPLSDFMVPEISELMFHNSTDMVMHFSLN